MKHLFLNLLFIVIFVSASAKLPIKVACVGNSITYGLGIENRERDSYPAQLQQMLGDEYKVGNFGKSGATLLNKGHRPYMQQDEFRNAMDFAGDIVVIHLGINDTDPRNWHNYRDYFVRDYIALIDSFHVVNPKVRILIARMSPITNRHPRFESGTRDWFGEIQEAIETVARHSGIQLIDFHEPLYHYPFMLPDAIHPTKEGAKILARKVYSAITGDYGGLQMPEIYTDNMVLLRNSLLKIQGIADAGKKVKVRIAGKNKETQTGLDGKWIVYLEPMKAGGPYTLEVSSGKQKLVYNDVLVGEVWLCSGQSNMAFVLNRAITGKRDIPLSDNEQIRLFDMKSRWRTSSTNWDISVFDSLNYLQYFQETKWNKCSPEVASDFSAVAYYFGKMLQDSLRVPIGLICNAVGGSPTEAWVSRDALEKNFPAIFHEWIKNDFIQDWVREQAAFDIKRSNNKFQRHPFEPCYLYEAGILPLEQFPIKGVIWYQGESNAHNCEMHKKLFHLLIDCWRKNWSNPELPFYYVQLSSLNRPSWAWFRDSQRQMMTEITHTGMAVSSDHGDSLDVHPVQKKPVGERLARWALYGTYGMKQVVPSGPLFRKVEFHQGKAYVSFDFAEGMHASDGHSLKAFEIAETEGLFYPARAEVIGNQVVVSNDKVKNPHYVRYAWQPFTRANLVNATGLPASTFRSY